MGVIRSMESMAEELEELRWALGAADTKAKEWTWGAGAMCKRKAGRDPEEHGRMVCVTSGVSFLGFALVSHLLSRGYTVRLVLENQEDLDKVREMDMFREMGRDGLGAVVANAMDMGSLCEAFDGCAGVFHTSTFVDPRGISGYTKHMAGLEVKVAENVVEACVRTQSVRKCVFTSSLLACIWRHNSPCDRRLAIDENCWSDESLCRDKKLWFALGKTLAEKAAWRAAHTTDLKLVTLCPALLTGPGFYQRNSTASIAYLKGAQEMFADNLLATADVSKVAEAHVCVYEEMSSTACGRYICFDHVITRNDEAAELGRQLGVPYGISKSTSTNNLISFELSNRKLSRLISASRWCSYDIYSILYS